MKFLKNLTKKPKVIGLISGGVVLLLLFFYMFFVQVKIKSKLVLFKEKMEEAGDAIDKIVTKFKKAGSKYDTDIEELKKELENLRKQAKEQIPTPSNSKASQKSPCEIKMEEAKACLAQKRAEKKLAASGANGEFSIEDDEDGA